MTTRNGAYVTGTPHATARVIEWTGLTAADDGQWRMLSHFKYKDVHVYGEFGGAMVVIEGSNEDSPTDANAVILHDNWQNEIAITTPAGLRRIEENPLNIRPRVVGGGGDTDLTVRLVCRD